MGKNKKRTYRTYSEKGLQVRTKRCKKQNALSENIQLLWHLDEQFVNH